MIKFFEWVDKHEATLLLYIIGFVAFWVAPYVTLIVGPILISLCNFAHPILNPEESDGIQR